jgi:hypothetical protein
MSKSSNSRVVVFFGVIGLTALVWILRGIGLFTFIPGFVLWMLILLSIVLAIVNGLIETR